MPATVRLPAKPRKYGNKITEYGGRKYHSAAEAKQAAELDLLVKAGKILAWMPQASMPIRVNGHYICTLLVDFEVKESATATYYLETKGKETPVSKLKRKLLMACYPGIDYRINGVKQPMLKGVALGSKA